MPNDKRYTVEGYWDCQYCGKAGIKGRFAYCPGCGHGRDKSVRFYTIETDEGHAITHEEFEREENEARKNSRSDSANYTLAQEVAAGTASLYGRGAGEGRGDERGQNDLTDWYCDYCDSYNPASAAFCANCGAAREMSDGTTYQQVQGTMARTYDAQGNLVSERDLSARATQDAQIPMASPKRTASKRGGCLPKLLIACGVVAVLAVLLSLLFAPKPKDITVAGFDWEQTIEIEQLQTVREDGWDLPSQARLVTSHEEIRTYEQVLDHYEEVEYEVPVEVLDHYETYTTEVDNGDGTFDVEEHQEPVYTTEYHTETRREPVYVSVPIYDTKYYYDIERWVHERDVTTSGDDHNPYWGVVELSEATGEHGTGEERAQGRSGTYGVTDSEGKHYTADLDFWEKLEIGQELKVMVDGEGHISPAE